MQTGVISTGYHLYEALEIFNTVAAEARSVAALTPAPPAKGSADAGKDNKDAATESAEDRDESEDDGEGDKPPEPSARERVAKSGAAAGQGAEGRATVPDRTKLRPIDLFQRHNRGEGYKPPVR